MPEAKGRKKGRNRERRRDIAVDASVVSGEEPSPAPRDRAPSASRAVQPALPEPRMPSATARVSGAMLAMITAVVAMVVLWNGFAAESTGDAIPRIIGGLLLVGLVIVLAMLSLAPEVVVRLFVRRPRA